MTAASPSTHEHDVLDRFFSEEVQRSLREEDLEASKNVLAVIIMIVTGGMMFGIFAVIMCLVMS